MIEQEQDQDQDWDTALLRLPLGPTQDLAKIGFGANQLLLNRALVQTEISGDLVLLLFVTPSGQKNRLPLKGKRVKRLESPVHLICSKDLSLIHI